MEEIHILLKNNTHDKLWTFNLYMRTSSFKKCAKFVLRILTFDPRSI